MRNKALIAVFVFICSSTITWAINTTGLIGYWNFDEGEGNTVYDSANGYDGIIYGASWVDGVFGSALSFNGIDNFVRLPKIALGDFTVAFWVKTTQVAPDSIGWWNGYGLVDAEKCEYLNDWGTALTGNKVAFGIGGNTAEWVTIKSTSIINDGNWHFITATRDGNTGEIALYVNAEKENEGLGKTGTLNQIDYIAVGNNACDVRDGDEWFEGLIDDVIIYDRVLPGGEIWELYLNRWPNLTYLKIEGPNEAAENSSAQYTAYANFSDGSTQDVTDSVDWAVMPDNYADINDSGVLSTYELIMPTEDVTIYAEYADSNDIFSAEKDVQIYADCSGGALELDGVNDYVMLPHNEPVWLAINDFSLSAWVKFDRDVGTQEVIMDLNFGDSGDPYNELGCALIRKDNGVLAFSITTVTAPDETLYSNTVLLPDKWYHIAAVRDGNYQAIYINGALDVSRSCSPDPIDYVGGYDDNKVNIGRYTRAQASPNYYLRAIIDEFIIINRAMSADQAQDFMYYGAEFGEDLIGYWKFDEGAGQIAYDSSGNGNDGYLGDDPCNQDTADPCWVDSGAPVHCTNRQLIVRNLEGAIEHKAAAQQQIDEALEREMASAKLLMSEAQGNKGRGWNPWIVLTPVREIYVSMQLEKYCQHLLQQSIKALERAIESQMNENELGPQNSHKGPKK